MKPGSMAAAFATLAFAGVAVFRLQDGHPPVTEPVDSAGGPPPARAPAKSASPRETRAAAGDPARLERVAGEIQEAVLTYQPAGVAVIRPYLLDPDPAIRREARDGLVQLGEADAVPWLRAAASRLEDPAEIAALREAADLLALPAWSDSDEAREAVEEIRRNR